MRGVIPILACASGIPLLAWSLAASSVVASPEPAGTTIRERVGTGSHTLHVTAAACPAPAVGGIAMRASAGPGGTAVTVFVVVQNLGDAAFHPPKGAASLAIYLGGREVRRFPIEDMAPGQVSFFRAAGVAAEGAGTVSARLVYAAGLPVGRVPGSLDCRMADNAATRGTV